MHARKKVILLTLTCFLVILAVAAIYRTVAVPKQIAFDPNSCPSIGNQNAGIEMVLFEDFACPSCHRFMSGIFPEIQAAYIEPGLAKFVLIPIVIHEKSKVVANAVLEIQAQAPQLVFPFLQRLIQEFGDRDPTELELTRLAASMGGVRIVDFAAGLRLGRYDQQLSENFQLAKVAMKKDLKTPTLFINGSMIHQLSFQAISERVDRIGVVR